jgi:Ca2+/H+ antiporter
MSILFPAALMLTQKQSFLSVLEVSRGSSVLAFFLYAALIFFQVKKLRFV